MEFWFLMANNFEGKGFLRVLHDPYSSKSMSFHKNSSNGSPRFLFFISICKMGISIIVLVVSIEFFIVLNSELSLLLMAKDRQNFICCYYVES